MLAIVMRENMELGDNTLNNERLTFVNTKVLPKSFTGAFFSNSGLDVREV